MRCLLRGTIRITAAAALLVLAVGAYVSCIGIPKWPARRLLRLDRLEAEYGVSVRWARLRWQPWAGLHADSVRLRLAGAAEATLTVSSVRVAFSASSQADRSGAWELRLDGVHGRWDQIALPILNARAVARIDETQVHVDRVMIENADDRLAGFVEGALHFDRETDAVNGAVFLYGRPDVFLTALPPPMRGVLEYTEFGAHANGHVDFDFLVSDPATLHCQGWLTVHDVRHRGEPVTTADAAFRYHDGQWMLDRIGLLRHDGALRGSMEIDSLLRLVRVDLRSTIPPDALARMVMPDVAARMTPYTIAPPVDIALRGMFRYGDMREMDLRVEGRGRNVGFGQVELDDVSLTAQITEYGIDILDLEAQWCGGHVYGHGAVEFPMPPFRPWFGFEVSLRGADLMHIAQQMPGAGDPRDYTGRVVGRLALAGPLATRQGRYWIGHGHLDITDGYLLTIPLFGGLSRYLSVLRPGLGYAAQRDFESTFEIRGGALRTTDAELLGNLITIRGRGAYRFDDRLDFRVVVNLFQGGGLLQRLTRIITTPIGKALEFELQGSPRDPSWRPLNTPRRLMRFFRRSLDDLID